ncbi:MAG: family 43 glycosylhydrolase [Prevotella sp.]|nr:family 43 glycosylhydrolase [Prevotella sp.]
MTTTKKLLPIIAAALLATACTQTRTFTNPVIAKDVPDPTVIRIGDTYYAAGTSGNAAKVYPMFQSQNLVDWQPIGHVFDEWPEWTAGAFWAPELFEHNGKTYCYYTALDKNDRHSCIGVAIADSPTSKFTDHGPLVKWTNEAIDSYVYNDNGQLYITWKAYGLDPRPIELLAQKLSSDGLHLEGEPFTILTDMEDLGMEGQCIFKHGKYYYILYAARDCCSERSDYEVRVARATAFEGPYEKYDGNPILRGDGKYIQSCGHGTLVESQKGRLFYLCHSYLIGKYHEGRQPILQELVIGKDGWPHFKTGNITIAEQPIPRL